MTRSRCAPAMAAVIAALPPSPGALAAAHDRLASFQQCRSVKDDRDRLACYDRAAALAAKPTFQGRLTMLTEPFQVKTPATLRYQSDGAIFVLYLKSESGAVLQNLHIGGGGEDSYRIEKPGTYRLQINGSESWRVWVEPEPGETGR